MIVEIIGAVGGSFVLLYIVASLVRAAGFGGLKTLSVQEAVNGSIAYALFSAGMIGLPIAILIGAMPICVRLFAYVWFYWQGRKVLNGEYGEQARWGAELVQDEDNEFIEASSRLSQVELREIGIISDDKQELRDKTVERAQESDE